MLSIVALLLCIFIQQGLEYQVRLLYRWFIVGQFLSPKFTNQTVRIAASALVVYLDFVLALKTFTKRTILNVKILGFAMVQLFENQTFEIRGTQRLVFERIWYSSPHCINTNIIGFFQFEEDMTQRIQGHRQQQGDLLQREKHHFQK